ncbi:hypothetical protein NEMIN01_0372 [Nematocida minor]|uniref:uncharacterized protein n=1 Tax=Nematocida minor TaxID=1912983 RepID=UPI0022200FE9|nr:uncharacterized protein NEMIN01_0372 [Nematocida minor]KAI5189206.1 hypothetical protein NEMIN01_0372 [Nematocida minor]
MKKLLDSLPRNKLSLFSAVATASFLSTRSNTLSSYKPILLDVIKSSTVIMSLPFTVGDSVSINNATGRVSSVSIKYVALESKEAVTYIPTHLLYGSIIKKYK